MDGVLDGSIPACKWVKLACQRHKDDVDRSKIPEYRWTFNEDSAHTACELIELFPHTKDDFENRAARRERLKLEPPQLFVVCSIFGWIDKDESKPKTYRFREAYVEIPRKNGKSTLAAGIGLVKFAADGEHGAEVYSGATTEKQAWEVFRPAKQMAVRTPEFLEAFGVTVNAKSLTIESNGSRFEPVIGKPGDGSSPSCAIIDEFHEHQSDDLISTMRTGMGARRNPLLFIITTAGSDRSSPCYQRHLDVKQLLDGRLQDDRLFGIIYTIDEKDDWQSLDAVIKANPNYGVSIEPDGLARDLQNAVQSARLQNEFKTKRENIWVNAAVSWMNMAAWDKCADKDLKIEQFFGERCWAGLDLASRIDLACKARMFKKKIDDKDHFYVFLTHYLNEWAIDNARNAAHYQQWQNEGRLVVTPGSMTDHKWIATDLISDCKDFKLLEVDHDPYGADSLVGFLQDDPDWDQGVEFVTIEQTVRYLSPSMKFLEAIVLDGRFHHDGDPILAWAIGNVVCKPDAKDNIFPRKERDENKIDPAVATMNCLYRAMLDEGGGSVYDERDLLVL